ncbi:hypothetical protein GN958_ATG18680, partial [Phytophthora infestans]
SSTVLLWTLASKTRKCTKRSKPSSMDISNSCIHKYLFLNRLVSIGWKAFSCQRSAGKCIEDTAITNQQHVVAILAANSRERTASWYHAQVVIYQIQLDTVDNLVDAFRREFGTPDQQFRLRAEHKACHQRGPVEDNIHELSAMDQADRLCDVPKSEKRKEVIYLQCGTLEEAIAAAQFLEPTPTRIKAVLVAPIIVQVPIGQHLTVLH